MAHIGKPGPVIFRRDFNLNVSNNTLGFYRRNNVRFFGLPPGDANVVNGFTFDAGPEVYPDKNSLGWDSDFVLVPVFQFKVSIKVTCLDGKTYIKTGALISKTGGIIFEFHWMDFAFSRLPRWDNTIPVLTDFWSPLWFDSEPMGAFCEVFGKAWRDGPPH